MKTKQEIRERIERIEQTNREDGWILGREIRERNQRIITVLKWVLGEVKDGKDLHLSDSQGYW